MWDKMHEMKMGEMLETATNGANSRQQLRRVPGGWLHIYKEVMFGTSGSTSMGCCSVFIPYSDEFKQRGHEIRGGQVSGPLGGGE